MAKNLLAARLIAEFGAQDCSTTMKVFHQGVHILVARFSEDQQDWVLTQEGQDLLNPPPPEPEVEKAPKNLNIAPAKKVS